MKPYQERVVTELRELNEKREKLEVFLSGETFAKMETNDRLLLLRQKGAMKEYATVLEERIATFKTE